MAKKSRKLIELWPDIYTLLVKLQKKRTRPGWPTPSIAFLANDLLKMGLIGDEDLPSQKKIS